MFSEVINAYYIDLLIPHQSQFKFIVDGKFMISNYYPKIKVRIETPYLFRMEYMKIIHSFKYHLQRNKLKELVQRIKVKTNLTNK